MQRLLQFPAAGPRALWIALIQEVGLRQSGRQALEIQARFGMTMQVTLRDDDPECDAALCATRWPAWTFW